MSDESTSSVDADRAAWAGAAVSRIQIRRELARRHARTTRVEIVLGLFAALAVLGVLALGVLALMRTLDMSYAKLVSRSMVLAWVITTVGVSAGIVVLVMVALGIGGLFVVPPLARSLVAGALRARGERRERGACEAELARTGELVDATGVRGVMLRAIARDDAALRYDEGRKAVVVAHVGPPETCPRCRAPLGHPSPGLRRCEHCAFERFDEPAARPEELVKARALIDKVLAGEAFTGDRAALWKKFKASTRREEPGMVIGMLTGGLAFALIGELGLHLGAGWLLKISRVGVFFLAVGAGVMIPIVVYHLYARRFRQFGPGVATYDRALAVDIITTLAQQGVMTCPALAGHLGVTPAHLEESLARLHALGIPAAYHDVRRDRLVSLHARTDLSACPACGGKLEAAALATLACAHCGGTVAPPR